MRKSESIVSYLDSYKQSYSDLFRVSIDPRVKPVGDRKESVPEGDERGRKSEGDNFYKVMPRFGTNRQTIFELMKNIKLSLREACLRAPWQSQQNKLISRDAHVGFSILLSMTKDKIIGRSLDLAYRLGGMTKDKIFSRDAHVGFSILLSMTIFLLSSVAKAECTPTPDCASIGYTATSCDGDSLKCPFDTSKLYCVPCDSSYKYDCSGTGYASGSGTSCNGKYVSCTCSSGYEWDGSTCTLSCAASYQYECTGTGYSGGSGTPCGGKYQSCTCTSGYEWSGSACVVKPDCNVGYIYYTDKTCSSSYNSSKTVAGIVVKNNALVMSKPILMTWSSDYDDVSDLTNITSSSTAQADMNGKSNTSTIVSYHTSIGESTSTSAALYCNSYTGGISGTAGDWYLPAAGELYSYVYGNYSTLNPVATTLSWSYFDGYWFWSSSEYGGNYAWYVYAGTGSVNDDSKGNNDSVSCLLAL